MGNKLYWLLFILIIVATVVITLFLESVKEERFWKAAADPNHRCHCFWLQAKEMYPEDLKEQRKIFLLRVECYRRSFHSLPPTKAELEELKNIIKSMNTDDKLNEEK